MSLQSTGDGPSVLDKVMNVELACVTKDPSSALLACRPDLVAQAGGSATPQRPDAKDATLVMLTGAAASGFPLLALGASDLDSVLAPGHLIAGAGQSVSPSVAATVVGDSIAFLGLEIPAARTAANESVLVVRYREAVDGVTYASYREGRRWPDGPVRPEAEFQQKLRRNRRRRSSGH